MSKQGSKKEFIFTLFLKKYSGCLGDLIGLPIEGIKIEKKIGSKRIDLYAINLDRKIEVFVENQLKPSDRSDHLKDKIIPLINNIAEGYVIWIASKFQKKHIDEIKCLISENPQKYINFYAVEVQQEVLKRIEYLNTLYELEVWNNLSIINEVDEKVKLLDCHIQMPQTHMGKVSTRENVYDFKIDYDTKEFLAAKLCEKLPQLLNVHTDKKHSLYNKFLTYGAGLGEVTYFCSAFDARHRATVGIRFEYSKVELYRYFKQNRELLIEKISPNLRFNDEDRTISYHIKSNRVNIPEIVDHLVGVFQKYILFFSPYTYGKKMNGTFNKLVSQSMENETDAM